mmetsp:Transcript_30179/g.63112  ORF Transcript_30179/g.63112 Transcript_30179/m.63112 type:complete len:103 (+) Transcript_30179:300-608(+)
MGPTWGARIVVYQAFKVGYKPYLIRSQQQDPDDPQSLRVNHDATSVCQLWERGMRMIQGSFPRLKDKMNYEVFGERKDILHLMVLLYNYQTDKVASIESLTY